MHVRMQCDVTWCGVKLCYVMFCNDVVCLCLIYIYMSDSSADLVSTSF